MATKTGFVQEARQATSFLFPGIKFNDEIPIRLITSRVASTLNQTANTVLVRSYPCPPGFAIRVRDYNFYVSTSGTGVAQLVRMTASGQIDNVVLPVISSSQSGIGSTVLTAGDSLAVIVGTQGTGTISSIDISADMVYIGDEIN